MRTSIIGGVMVSILAACEGAESIGGAGPPEILQVLVRERAAGEPGPEIVARLAYGDHPDIDLEVDDRAVTAAVARDSQRIRVVVDELMRGDSLEEVACADGSWSRVPAGATFEDVARCAGADLASCKDICIVGGAPVGILDANGDGAIDDTRLIDGAAVLTCDGAAVPLDPQRSYYQPSGSQLLSTGSVGTDSLGPAIVLAPAGGMKPGARCGLAFADTVVDKQGERIADPSAISFTVEPFTLAWSEPAAGAEEVPLTAEDSPDAVVTVRLNATLDAATVTGAVAITADGASVDGATPLMAEDDDATIVITIPGGFRAATTYRLTVSATLADVHADTLGEDRTIEWTTAEGDE